MKVCIHGEADDDEDTFSMDVLSKLGRQMSGWAG
jgi:hypothetical protein